MASSRIIGSILSAIRVKEPEEALRLLQEQKPSAESLRYRQNIILRLSASYGFASVLKQLAVLGLNHDDACAEECEALFYAASNNHLAAVSVLVSDFGMDDADANANECAPFSEAAARGHDEMLILLGRLFFFGRRYLGVSFLSANYYYGFCKAVENGHLGVVKLLFAKFGLKPEEAIKVCFPSPYCTAIKNGHLEMVKYLTENFELSAYDLSMDYNRPFLTAVREGRLDILRYLVSKGLNAHNARAGKNISIEEAICHGYSEILELLADLGLSRRDAVGKTYSYRSAAHYGYAKVFEVLADRFELTSEDMAPYYEELLLRANSQQHKQVVEVLESRFGPKK